MAYFQFPAPIPSAISQSLTPDTTNSYDLGSTTLLWRDINSAGLAGFGGRTAPSSDAIVFVGNANPLSGVNQRGITINMTTTSAATSDNVGVFSNITTANSSYTAPYRIQFWAANRTKGAASTIGRDIGYYVEVPTQGNQNAAIADNVAFSGSFFINSSSTNTSLISGDFKINTAGKGLFVKEGSNAKMGTATLTAGSATVSTTAVAATSRIFLTSNTDGGTPGFVRVSARSAGTSFTITSSSGTDTSTIAWMIVDPA